MIPQQLVQPLEILVWLFIAAIVASVALVVLFIAAVIYTLATDKKKEIRR